MLTLAAKQERVALYGVYLPVRGRDGTTDAEVRTCFEALDDAMLEETEERVMIGGDFNAETPAWRARRGRRAARETVYDEMLSGLLADHALVAQAKSATYRPETVGTQIDNWLVSENMSARMGRAETVQGVCGDDHQALVACSYARASAAGSAKERPKGSPAGKMSEEDEKEYGEGLQERYERAGGEMDARTFRRLAPLV